MPETDVSILLVVPHELAMALDEERWQDRTKSRRELLRQLIEEALLARRRRREAAR